MKPLFLGKGRSIDGAEDEGDLLLTASDLDSHVHGLGGTRSGKSKLIEWLARQLITQRHGFCLIDPHGTLYRSLVQWLAYLGGRRRDIVLFDPSSESRLVGFNPFVRGREELTVRVDRLVRTTVKAWGASDSDETPRLERWLRCIYHTLLEGGYTLEVLEYLLSFSRAAERDYLTAGLHTDLIREEWASLARYTRAVDFDNQIESARNRLFRFISSTQILRVMGVNSHLLDVEDIVREGKVLLVNLQPTRVLSSQQAELMGTLLLDEIWQVVGQREAPLPRPFFAIIDEFQKYLTPDIPEMLDEAAKRNFHLMLFHQRLDQLRKRDEEAYSAVMTNARVKLVFGALSREDADTMVKEIFPGQIDLHKVKHVIRQTKFWPTYQRDVAYHSSKGSGSGVMAGVHQTWSPEAEDFVLVDASSGSEHSAEQEGSTDLPIFVPEPFTEETGRTTYALDELVLELSDRLMEQYQRHFMFRRPGRETVAAVAPYVTTWHASDKRILRYTESLLSEYPTPTMVDEQRRLVREEVSAHAAPVVIRDDERSTDGMRPKPPGGRKPGSRPRPPTTD